MSKCKYECSFVDDNIVFSMMKKIRENSTVLEFGPAYGRLTKYLSENLNCTVDIVEIDKESGLEASVYARKALVGPDLGDIDTFKWVQVFSGNKYDYIIFADVLEHLRYPERVIENVYGMLKDDGCILVSIPNIAHNSVLINLYNNIFHYTDTGLLDESHIHFWGLYNFKEMVNRSGYVITDIIPFYLETANSEQAKFFGSNASQIELLLKNRPHGKIYQYLIQLHKKDKGQKEFNLDNLSKQPFPMAIYLDSGFGFDEQNKIADTVFIGEEIEKVVNLDKDVESIRIDPIEGTYSRVKIQVDINSKTDTDLSKNNAIGIDQAGFYTFITDDPWFVMNGPFKKGNLVKIKLLVYDLPIWEALNFLMQEHNAKEIEANALRVAFDMKNEQTINLNNILNEKEAAINILNSIIDLKNREIDALTEKLCMKDSEIESIKARLADQIKEADDLMSQHKELIKRIKEISAEKEHVLAAYSDIRNSTCWKITKPARIILDFFKRIYAAFSLKMKIFLRFINTTILYLKHFGLKATIFKIKIKLFGYGRKKSYIPVQFDYTENDTVNTGKSVSVVIPTKNAGESFELLLKNLRNQKGFSEIEIIVVDSGSSDRTIEISQKYGARVIQIKPEEFSHSYSRNIGAENASKEYVCVITQDALPTSEYWMYHLYRIMQNDPEIAAVSCAEYSRADSDLYHRAFAWNHYKYLGAHNTDTIMIMPDSKDPEQVRQNAQLSDITCFISRDTLLKYKYRGSFAEDLDLGMRLISDGYKLAFLGNEATIHSHNRGAYYYLKRRFVELVTLKRIFPEQPILKYRYDQVIKETIFIYYYITNIFKALHDIHVPIKFSEFRESFVKQYRDIRKNLYPSYEIINGLSDFDKVDKQTEEFLTDIIKQYKQIVTKKNEYYEGLMVDAMEGYINVVLDFMAECYEVIDYEIISEYKECVYKLLASVAGTFFAYSYLSDEDDRDKHIDFYNAIGVGV